MGNHDDPVHLAWRTRDDTAPRDEGSTTSSSRVVETTGVEDLPGNCLFTGDNRPVMEHLVATGETVDMIYIDPPFFTGLDFKACVTPGKRRAMYTDSWQDGLPGYLDAMRPRLQLMHALLRDGGSMYVHLDWHVCHYIKVVLDEIFGYEHFRNQIIWKRLTYKQTQVKSYGVLHDVILYYTKGKDYTWNDIRAPYGEDRLRRYFRWIETPDGKNMKLNKQHLDGTLPVPGGRRFALNPVINPNPDRPNLTYEFLGFTRVWKYTKQKMNDYLDRGIIFQPSSGALPQKKQYLDESPGMKLNDIFVDVGAVMGGSAERVGFDTQKPLNLLERFISVSSNPGDIVADFFAGSGTTLVAAGRLGRRWIGCELSPGGVHVIKKRLLAGDASFTIRQVDGAVARAWHRDPGVHRAAMLDAFGALPVSAPDELVHGHVNDVPVHVVPFNTMMDTQRLCEVAAAVRKRGIDAMFLLATRWMLDIPSCLRGEKDTPRLHCIVMPQPGTTAPEPSFFHVPAVGITTREHMLHLDRYIVPAADGSGQIVLEGDPTITLDYLAIDWHHEPGNPFKNEFHTFKDRKVSLVTTSITDPRPGETGPVAIHLVDVHGRESLHVFRRG